LDEHFFYSDSSFRTLCNELKTVDDIEYVAFLRDFVFQSVSPGRRKRRKPLRPIDKIIADLKRAERLLKRLHNDLSTEFYPRYAEPLTVFFRELREGLEEPSSRPATPLTWADIFGQRQFSARCAESYQFPLVAWASIFRREAHLRGWEKAIVDVADYLRKQRGKRGRPEQRAVKLMSLALEQLMRKRTGKPDFPLVERILNEHFDVKVSQGYLRQRRPSKSDEKALRQIFVIYQNRHRLHPSQFPH
jgi:hypothetical protein